MQNTYIIGDLEREQGLEVSPLMDRNKPNVPRSQVYLFCFVICHFYAVMYGYKAHRIVLKKKLGFIDFFIRPLFETWVQVVPESKQCVENLHANREYYESLVIL